MIRRSVPLVLVLLFAARSLLAQDLRVKASPLTAMVLVPYVGVEVPRGTRGSIQIDAAVSAWRSVRGAPFQFVMLTHEWRRYGREGHLGPYAAVHVGVTGFRLQKPIGLDRFQEGGGVYGGLSVGMQAQLADRWLVDWYVGGGTLQTKYKGYLTSTGERYDGEEGWNESGEWLPYRTGVLVSYRWKR